LRKAAVGNLTKIITMFKHTYWGACAYTIAALSYSNAALAHVTLEQPNVEAGTYYKATLRVGHGCEGLPTAVLRVQVPEGFQGAKPMPKPGWTLAVLRTKLAKPYDNHGKPVTEDVSEITWTANSPDQYLADAHYDEFALRGKSPTTIGPLWFKATQLCKDGDKTGRNAWDEVPASGTSTQGLKSPAALLNVVAPTPAPTAKPAEHKH
jgi:periplasmic copper chaperone A